MATGPSAYPGHILNCRPNYCENGSETFLGPYGGSTCQNTNENWTFELFHYFSWPKPILDFPICLLQFTTSFRRLTEHVLNVICCKKDPIYNVILACSVVSACFVYVRRVVKSRSLFPVPFLSYFFFPISVRTCEVASTIRSGLIPSPF